MKQFIDKINKTKSCWLWTGNHSGSGYGEFWYRGAREGAHRFAYKLWVGPIPKGLHIDHLCRVHSCVNPKHLEAVTPRLNTLRGIGPAAKNAAKTECLFGHPFDIENTYINKDGDRECKECRREATRRWRSNMRLSRV